VTLGVFGSLSLPVLLLIFVGAAALVWVAGVRLSNTTDVLSMRLGLGEALGGLIMLAIVTNLPEIAITVSAALSNELGVAVGNILGGIAIQTVVLVVIDAFGVRGRYPLTYRAASLVLVLEGALVIGVLTVAVMGSQLPPSLIVWRIEPEALLIAVLWVAGLLLLNRARSGLPWQERGEAPEGQEEPRGHSKDKKDREAQDKGVSTGRAAVVFCGAALVTLVGGVVLERSGEAIAGDVGMSGVLFGSTVLAAATSLPEVSTGLTSVRLGDYQLAVSDIFGGNAFLPVGGRAAPGPGHRHLPYWPGDTAHSRLRVGLDLQTQAPCLANGARFLDGPGAVRLRDSGIGRRGPRWELK
jgi:cation:H+ antiporter